MAKSLMKTQIPWLCDEDGPAPPITPATLAVYAEAWAELIAYETEWDLDRLDDLKPSTSYRDAGYWVAHTLIWIAEHVLDPDHTQAWAEMDPRWILPTVVDKKGGNK